MTDAPKKTDEPAVIQVTVGPYAGQRLTMSKAEAEAAVAEKWAIDPNAPVDPKASAEPPKALTEEECAQIKAKAEAAARKLRGEPELAVTRDMTAEHPAPYSTKTAPKK
jgi:hypothetical protein